MASCIILHASGCSAARAEPADGSVRAQRAALVATWRARLTRSPDGLVAERQADGSVRVRLGGRFQSLSLRDAQGRTACVDSPEGLDRMLDTAR